ncbi:MAG: hypothetical protein ACK57N_04425 [Planctomycetia bacterium]|jgi:hypothetical protein
MDLSLLTVFLGCSALGGLVLVVQTALLFFGHDDGGDTLAEGVPEIGNAASGEIHHDEGLGLLSIRSVASFFCFFGLGGWMALAQGLGNGAALGVGLLSGAAMLFAVAWLFSLQKKLHSAGNMDTANAVGRTARVYIRIPANNAGKGKVQVLVQGRTGEFQACTRAARDLESGSEVRIVKQITLDTFEVEPLS